MLGATFSVFMMSKHTPEHVNWKNGSCRFRPMVSSPPPSSPPPTELDQVRPQPDRLSSPQLDRVRPQPNRVRSHVSIQLFNLES